MAKQLTAKTQSELAKLLRAEGVKITQQAIAKRIANDDFPKGPPWSVSECVAFLKSASEPSNAMAKAKLDLLVKRAAKLEIENTLALGGYLKREDVERSRVERIHAVRAELSNIRLVAMKLEGKTVPQMEEILEDYARTVCRKFSAGEG